MSPTGSQSHLFCRQQVYELRRVGDGPKQDIQMVMACLLSGEGGIFSSAACTYLSWNEARELLKPLRMSTPGTRRNPDTSLAVSISVPRPLHPNG
jgi:hypothetical protein